MIWHCFLKTADNLRGSPQPTVDNVRQLLGVIQLATILVTEGDAVDKELGSLVANCF